MKRLLTGLRESIVIKTILTIVIVLAVYAFAVCLIGFNEVTDALLDQYADGAFRTAGIASQILEPSAILQIEESGGEGEAYEDVTYRLRQICNSAGVTFIYAIVPDRTDYKHITFLVSVMNQNVNYSQYEFGYVRETTNEDYENAYRRMCEAHSARELVVRNTGYIETDPHITAMIPLVGKDGETLAILCVQRQMDDLNRVRNSYVNKVLIALIVTAVLITIGLSLRLNYSVLRPIRIISAEAARFAKENVQTKQKLTGVIRSRDDIGHLAGSIDEMETQIHNYVEHLTQATAERERIRTELTLASRIQENMLPGTFPAFPGRSDFDIFASMDPAREIGGDFYNFFLTDDDHLCIYIADVSGKGVPAALLMMAATIVIANNAMMGKSPAQILEGANDGLCASNREEMFITVWIGMLDLKTGILTAANAGHEYPVLRHPGGRFELIKDKHGFVVGGIEGMVYQNYEIRMEPGTKLFVYTDGVPEASSSTDELFGTGRMLSAMNASPDADPVTLLENIKKAVNDFVGSAEQFDDMTMLCLEYKGQPHTDLRGS